jgi:ATP-binding cassette, subfamily B, multidrug efflux pump
MVYLRFLSPFLADRRRQLIIGLTAAVLAAVAAAFGPRVLGYAVDDLLSNGLRLTVLLQFAGLYLLLAALDAGLKFVQRMMIAGSSHRIEHALRMRLLDHLLRLDQRFYGEQHTGDLMARMTNDLSAVRQLLGPGLNGSASALLTFVAAAVLMLSVDLRLALLVLLLLPLTAVIFSLIGSRMRRVYAGVQQQFGTLSTRVQENFSAIRTMKAYAQEQAEVERFFDDNERYRRLNLRYVLLSGSLWPTTALLMGIIGALVLFVGGRLVAARELSIGELVQFQAYLALLAHPMIMLGWMLSLAQQAAASMDRLLEVLRRRPQIAAPAAVQPLPAVRGALTLEDVVLELPGADGRPRRLLDGITLRIPAGSSLALVGATGSGKSTLAGLFARVRDPDRGRVLLDGSDLRDLDPGELRRAFAYVPQESLLFSVPLRENILFSDPTASDEQLDRAVRVSRLINDLDQLPDGLATLIGERGVTLSGGQKQRVAIARAVLRNAPILVLDDALSSVDTHTAAEILHGLRDVMRGRTTILIAQRMATVRDADTIVVLDEGRIIESGTHQELLDLNRRYAAMYRRELRSSAAAAELDG